MKSALIILLKAQAAARFRRLTSAFSTPRRVLLSVFLIILAVVWTGQTVASVLFRDPYAPEAFRHWVAALLFAWFAWHLIRVAWKRPDVPVEWTDEEESLIVSGPFTARECLAYRFVVILTATLPKACLTLLVLWPDLSWTSPFGLIVALVGLEMFRMLMDISTCCLSQRSYWIYRIGVATALGTLILAGQQFAANSIDLAAINTVEMTNAEEATRFLQSAMHHDGMALIAAPFLAAADVVAMTGSLQSLLAKMIGMLCALVVMVWLIERLYATALAAGLKRERWLWKQERLPGKAVASGVLSDVPLPKVPFFGPLVWRQARRALHYSGGLIISMTIPALLLLPLMSIRNPTIAFLLVVAGALFYTFVLLPEALKFDFRLDTDHLCQLKMLPLTPRRIVIGQLATPVLLAAFFQLTIFLGVGIFRAVDPRLIVGAMAFSLPLTVLFVALENLVFLLYPHRPTQEGFEAFVRTILKFTGKSLLMLLFAGAVVLWAPIAAIIAGLLSVSTQSVFGVGIVFGIGLLAGVAVQSVISAFRRFDVSLHAIS